MHIMCYSCYTLVIPFYYLTSVWKKIMNKNQMVLTFFFGIISLLFLFNIVTNFYKL